MNNKVDQFIEKPKKALFALALPIVIAMFVQTMYTIVDMAFVGRLGVDSIAAVTFAFPLFFVLMSLNSGISVGANSSISRFLGAKNKNAAENAALHGLFLSIVLAGVVFVLGMSTLRPLFLLFGATSNVLDLGMSYIRIILLGIFFMFPSFVLNSIFAAQGDTKTPMKVQISALILNAILDPLFIYVLGYGVRGAAIATSLAYVFSLILFMYYIRRKSYLRIQLRYFKFAFPLCKEIYRVGAPASLTMLLLSVYFMFINRFMAHFGTNYVASYGLASRLESFAVMPIVALSIALLTLTGMFYGAKRYDLLKYISCYGLKIGIIFTLAVGLLFFIFPSLFLQIFTKERVLLSIGSPYIRIDVFTFPMMAVSILINRILQGMGFGFPGLVISLTRVMIVAVPLAYFFVFVLGYSYLSIAVAMVLGGVASSIVAFAWLRTKLRKLKE